jgi:uncharacterized membrane protein HdeD (DUF308 family)
MALPIGVREMDVTYATHFWVQLIPFFLIAGIFGLVRFRTHAPRVWWWFGLLFCGAAAVAFGRYYVSEPIASDSTLWWWLYYVGAAVVLDRARLSQLEGRKTIL